jgi:hypothetical protein
MDFDYRSKHNSRFHQDMIKRRKHIRYEVVGAPRNPFDAAAARKPLAQATSTITSEFASSSVTEGQSKELELHNVDDCLSSEKGHESECSQDNDQNEIELLSDANSMATANKRSGMEYQCDEETHSGPVELLSKDSQETGEFKGNVSTDGLLEGKCGNLSVKQITEHGNSDSESTISESGTSENIASLSDAHHAQPLNDENPATEDCAVAGILGQLLDLVEEGKALHWSYEGEDYCKDVFLSTVQEFALGVKQISCNLSESAKEALTKSHEEKIQQNVLTTDADSSKPVNLARDPCARNGITLTEKEKQYLICKGPYQPHLEKYPTNAAISKTKQNTFTAKWFKTFPYLEYSPTVDRAFCFACRLFGDGARCAETNWTIEGVNRWDKMRSRGKKKLGKLEQHFASAAHKLSVERLQCFSQREMHIDVALNSERKKQLALEEQERLHSRKVIFLLLDCCRYLTRQSLAFRGGDDDSNGNFHQLVHLLAKWVPFLDHWLSNSHLRSHQVTYLSPKSQNEFVLLAVKSDSI